MVKNGRQLVCADEFTSIWITLGETLYAAHTPCGDDGQWYRNGNGKLGCLKCGSIHPRSMFLTVEESINIHEPRTNVERWVAWFYNVLPETVVVEVNI